MTFVAHEESREAGNPVQLFKFIYGTEVGQHYAYTDHTEELIVDGITYSPVPIQRSGIESNGTLDKSAIRINADIGTELAEIFRVYPPAYVVTLVIAQGHVGDVDEEFVVIWAGRVIAANRNKSELVLSAEPVSTSLRRPGLRRHYQYGCPHQLYGPKCQANKAAATVSSTVDSIAGATVTLDAGWEGAFSPAKFLGGMLEWTTDEGSIDRRTILRVSGDTLSLSGIPQGLAATDAVDVVLGCNHKAYAEDGGDCQPLHDNIVNYGGFRWIPTKNPIGTFNNYY
jgi:hypothetical protein